MRGMSRVPCAVSCTKEFLEEVDRRARSLGMTRSAYIVQVLRQDIISGKPNLSIIAQQSVVNGNLNTYYGMKVASERKPYNDGRPREKRKRAGRSKPKEGSE